MIRIRFPHGDQFRANAPEEQAVYSSAQLAWDGATILFVGGAIGLHLASSANAAALESLARSLRTALEQQEQRDLQLGAGAEIVQHGGAR